MTKDKITAALRALFFGGGPVALLIIAKTGISSDQYNLYFNAAMAIVPTLIVGAYELYIDWRNQPDVKVHEVQQLSDVDKIVVKNGTNGAIGKMAASESYPKVVDQSANENDVRKAS